MPLLVPLRKRPGKGTRPIHTLGLCQQFKRTLLLLAALLQDFLVLAETLRVLPWLSEESASLSCCSLAVAGDIVAGLCAISASVDVGLSHVFIPRHSPALLPLFSSRNGP